MSFFFATLVLSGAIALTAGLFLGRIALHWGSVIGISAMYSYSIAILVYAGVCAATRDWMEKSR